MFIINLVTTHHVFLCVQAHAINVLQRYKELRPILIGAHSHNIMQQTKPYVQVQYGKYTVYAGSQIGFIEALTCLKKLCSV